MGQKPTSMGLEPISAECQRPTSGRDRLAVSAPPWKRTCGIIRPTIEVAHLAVASVVLMFHHVDMRDDARAGNCPAVRKIGDHTTTEALIEASRRFLVAQCVSQ